MLKAAAIILVLGLVSYLLYINGCLLVQAKRAVLFVGSMRGSKARFTACSGSMKRVIRFKADKTCRFTLNAELEKGEMTVELLDAAKRTLLRLDGGTQSGVVTVEENKRYTLVFRFRSATGSYDLRWD